LRSPAAGIEQAAAPHPNPLPVARRAQRGEGTRPPRLPNRVTSRLPRCKKAGWPDAMVG